MLLLSLFLIPASIVAVVLYFLGWIIYCRYFHPLHPIPGPFLASISRAWVVYKTWLGNMEHTQRALHKKHGEKWQSSNTASKIDDSGYLIRIAPNEVACADPDAIKVMIRS